MGRWVEYSKNAWPCKNAVLYVSIWFRNDYFRVPGECNHQTCVKDTDFSTQGRIDSFCSQVARRFYETMLLDIVKQSHESHNKIILPPPPPTGPIISLTHEYLAYFCDLEQDTLKQSCQWKKKREGEPKCEVHCHLMLIIAKYASDKG